MIKLEQIKQKLTDIIKQSGMPQSELARRLGINPATVSHYMHGNKMPSLDTFANICAILGVDANDILCIGEYKKNN